MLWVINGKVEGVPRGADYPCFMLRQVPSTGEPIDGAEPWEKVGFLVMTFEMLGSIRISFFSFNFGLILIF